MITMGLMIVAIMLMALIAAGLTLDTTFTDFQLDRALQLKASAAETASTDNTGLDLEATSEPGVGRPMAAILNITACVGNDGNETYTFHLEESADNITYTTCSQTISWTRLLTGNLAVPGFVSKRYVRLSSTIGGTTPSITYSAKLVPLN